MTKESKHPKIFSDVVALFEMYYRIHEGMPKSFRITVVEQGSLSYRLEIINKHFIKYIIL